MRARNEADVPREYLYITSRVPLYYLYKKHGSINRRYIGGTSEVHRRGILVVSLEFRHQIAMHQHKAVGGELKDFERIDHSG